MRKVRVRVGDLKHGMRVADDIYALNGTLIALKNSVVDKRLLALLEKSKVRDINVLRETIPKERVGRVATREFTQVFEKIHRDIEQTFDRVLNVGEEINTKEVTEQLEYLIVKAGSNYDLLNMLLDMEEESDSTYQHSIQVAMLSRVLGTWLELPEKDIALLGVAGLFHDIGKCRIDAAILNKTEPLSRAEYELVCQHTVMGYKIVKNKHIDIRVKQAVLSHHERCDGSGYPLALKADGIGQFARIVAIADVYAAMTAKRSYRDRKYSPFEVVNYLEQEGFGKFDSKYLLVFLSRILDSYIHRKVQLDNGETGEVMFINKANVSRPLLKVSNGYLDLSLNPNLNIVKVL